MSERATPETTALNVSLDYGPDCLGCVGSYRAMTDHARTLERQRDAAWEALEAALRANIRELAPNERSFSDEPQWAQQARAALAQRKL